MVDSQNRGIQVPNDLTDIIKVEVKGESLRRFLVQLLTLVNTQTESIAALETRIKALEDGNSQTQQ